jgi:catechol 2,3-dioxygenase-like lactoylglutathione lyase family enzyme
MSEPRVAGLNHVTLAVTDLDRSVSFYQDTLGFRLHAIWNDGAYLEAGALWLCLSLDPNAKHARRDDYTHLALDVARPHFEALAAQVRTTAPIWKENRSEGASLYFLDPDGHKLELHVGSLASRLQHYRDYPSNGRTLLD